MRVLIAEDEPGVALTIAQVVESFGYQTIVTHGGEEAWERLIEEPTSIVLTDWSMPGIDGLELCRRIRMGGFEHYTYLIFLTSRDDRDHLLSALSCGADDFLAKPLDPEELRVRLLVAQRIVTLERELRAANQRLLVENADLAHRSRIDALTGIGNRRAFEERVNDLHRRALRRGMPYSVIMCDIDRFKGINDTYGHRAGDEILRAVAHAIRLGLRQEDQPFRYGGEEIVLLLDDQDRTVALSIAERLRSAIENCRFQVDGEPKPIRVTVSCGVASYPESCGEGSDWAAVVERADRAMYMAKHRGRNCVWDFEPSKTTTKSIPFVRRDSIIKSTVV